MENPRLNNYLWNCEDILTFDLRLWAQGKPQRTTPTLIRRSNKQDVDKFNQEFFNVFTRIYVNINTFIRSETSENAGNRSLPFNYLYECYTSWKLRRRMKCASLCSTAFVRNFIRTYTRAVRKVSVHFEYLENRSRGLEVTWQPVRGDHTVRPWTVTLPWG